MLAALKNVLIAHFRTQMAVGGSIFGIKDIRSGMVKSLDVAGIKFPFISIYVEKMATDFAGGNSPYYMAGMFTLELYTVSNKGQGEAEDECLRLYLSDDMSTGIIKLFHDKQGYAVGSQSFLVTPNKEEATMIAGTTPEDAFTYAIRLPLRVTTYKG